MKFKVCAHKVEHVADMTIEAENKVEAVRKAEGLLDTENGVYILVVDLDSLSPTAKARADQFARIINSMQSSLRYQYYMGGRG